MNNQKLINGLVVFLIGGFLGMTLGFFSRTENSIPGTNFNQESTQIPILGNPEDVKNPENLPVVTVNEINQSKEGFSSVSMSVRLLQKSENGYIATTDDENRIEIIITNDTKTSGSFEESAPFNYATIECMEIEELRCRASFILISPVG